MSLDGLGVAEAKARIIEWLETSRHGRGAVTYRLEPDMTHAWLNLFNNALFPEASHFVEPRLGALIQAIRDTLASVTDSPPSAR